VKADIVGMTAAEEIVATALLKISVLQPSDVNPKFVYQIAPTSYVVMMDVVVLVETALVEHYAESLTGHVLFSHIAIILDQFVRVDVMMDPTVHLIVTVGESMTQCQI